MKNKVDIDKLELERLYKEGYSTRDLAKYFNV